jgi:PST family polysaccharide transporter
MIGHRPALAAGQVRPLAALALLGGSRGLAAALAFAAVAVVARRLTPADLGVWSLILAVQGYALHLGELGLRSVVTAEGRRTEGGAVALLPTYLALRLAVSGTVVAAVAAIAWLSLPERAPVVLLAMLALLATALQLDWLALVDDRPAAAGALLLVRPLAFALMVGLWPGRLGLVSLAGLFALSWALGALASWPLLGTTSMAPRGSGDPPVGAGLMLRLGIPLCAVTLLNQAQLSLDLLLVGVWLGTTAAAHYYLASGMAVAALVLANAAGQLATARLGPLRDAPGALAAALAGEAGRLARLALLLVATLAFVAPSAVPLAFGAGYAPAARLLLWLLPWLALQHQTTLLQGALAALRGQRTLVLGNLVLIAVLLPALLLTLWLGSLEGCALARGLAEAARLAWLVAALPPEARRQLVGAAGGPLLATLAVAAAGLLLT